MAFFDPVHAVFIPRADPGVNAGAMHVEQLGEVGRGMAIGAQQNGLQAQRHARGLVRVRLLAQGQAFAARAGVGAGEEGFQGSVCCVTNARTWPGVRGSRKEKPAARAPSCRIAKQRGA